MHLPLTTPPGRSSSGTSSSRTSSPGAAGEADLAELVRARRQVAVERLTAAAGNASLCTLSRSGEPRPTVKYLEGAVSALSDVQRTLRGPAHDPAAGPAAAAAVSAVRERWVARRGQSAASSPAWQAYLDGAVDELDELAAAVDGRAEALPAEDGGRTPQPAETAAQQRQATSHQQAAEASPPNATPTESLSLVTSRPTPKVPWPRRRTVATAVLAPALFAALVATGGGWTPLAAPAWTALVTVTSVVGAATLSTYLPLPGQGRRPNVGCTPCAAVSAMTVLGAAWLLGSAPLQPTMAAVALAAVTFGLVQRVTGAGASCAT
ncbi:hypothetical protein KZX45_09445 [Georgenia sp. EYE_87]|uniref:hypothetical protein n=1 Tax=Georgenia sp. EYE_87 TaxID=2853448 RepID=UPI002004C0A9|nr:hypothetical protein [Georgenia sp. EYE_87]MCK6210764.1 hypothetical protein [Georgenia sp. EYE_87]